MPPGHPPINGARRRLVSDLTRKLVNGTEAKRRYLKRPPHPLPSNVVARPSTATDSRASVGATDGVILQTTEWDEEIEWEDSTE